MARRMLSRRAFAASALGMVMALSLVGCSPTPPPVRAEKPEGLTLDLGNGLTMEFVLIPAGKFLMGSPTSERDREGDEGPRHWVTISRAFYMGMYEVTQEQYERVMGQNPSYLKGASNPIETVSWDDAQEFCRRLSRETGRTVRLPTEAEWEYACRAGTTTPFNTGKTISSDQANYDGRWVYAYGRKGVYRHKTLPVGSFNPNAWRLHDMHGNVQEWCSDWYGEHCYAGGDSVDPSGPPSGTGRVLRGGDWYQAPDRCRSAYRVGCRPQARSLSFGFRVVMGLR